MTPDMLDRAWRMGYLAGCNDPSMERIVRDNLNTPTSLPVASCFCGQRDQRERVHGAHACEPWSSPASAEADAHG